MQINMRFDGFEASDPLGSVTVIQAEVNPALTRADHYACRGHDVFIELLVRWRWESFSATCD
jgi:hypothetical protein